MREISAIFFYICPRLTQLLRTAKDIFAEMAVQRNFAQILQSLVSYAAYLVKDPEDARDIVSAAFASVLQSSLPVEESAIVPYHYRTVHNLSLNHRRDSARHLAVRSRIQEREGKAFQYYSTLLESCDPSDLFVSEISAIHSRILSQMPAEIQQTYQLRCEGHSYKEIASLLGINENKVDKNLRKILAALKLSLSDYLD